MSAGKSMPWWQKVLAGFAWIVLILLLVSSDFMDQSLVRERNYVERDLGEESCQYVYDEAADWYKTLFVDSGIYTTLHRTLIPNEDEKQHSRGMETMGSAWFKWIEGRLDASMRVIYMFLTRCVQMLLWIPFIPLVFLPAFYDGLMVRKIKRTNFDYSSPALHSYAVRSSWTMAFFLFLGFFAPVAIAPVVFPIVIFICGSLMGLSVANIQKRV